MQIHENPVHASDDEVSAALAALAHPARIAILRHLACSNGCCCKDVVAELDLAQSTVSQHLKVLVRAGLVDFRPERQRSRYSLNGDALAGLAGSIAGLVESCCAGAGAGVDAGMCGEQEQET
ncbi:MAG: metalloregulator ArsR/SmtB family transcription factor [Rhizobiaceae bacterium]